VLRRRRSISFEDLVRETGEQLAELKYAQRPQILGPTKILKQKVPWSDGGPGRRSRAGRKAD